MKRSDFVWLGRQYNFKFTTGILHYSKKFTTGILHDSKLKLHYNCLPTHNLTKFDNLPGLNDSFQEQGRNNLQKYAMTIIRQYGVLKRARIISWWDWWRSRNHGRIFTDEYQYQAYTSIQEFADDLLCCRNSLSHVEKEKIMLGELTQGIF